MIEPSKFFNKLSVLGISYFTGVPDSLLKSFCAFVSDHVCPGSHVIAANEGSAVSLAIGYYLATGNLPLVYMQNSGLGNAINPLISLADQEVYGIPMLLMIGWRGEPDTKDEPQHIKQGRVTIETLDVLGVPYVVIDGDLVNDLIKLDNAVEHAKANSCVFALVVRREAFAAYQLQSDTPNAYAQSREDVIRLIVDCTMEEDVIVSTTGMTSRELFEYRRKKGCSHNSDFLTVGGMGHASQIALGIASQKKNRKVICVDGDGAVIMHLGGLAICGQSEIKNFKHIVINNGAHDSVGGQPTVAMKINIPEIGKACGYKYVNTCDSLIELPELLSELFISDGPGLLEVKVAKGSRSDLGRPTSTPKENKDIFMENLRR